MSNHQEIINILNRASSASNENERTRLVNQANKLFASPDFLKNGNNNNNYNNNYSHHQIIGGGLPGNAITPIGATFYGLGYGIASGGYPPTSNYYGRS